ncbi:hypothetical protein VTI74DRAFT_6822 [Chaetomium olivicolor]
MATSPHRDAIASALLSYYKLLTEFPYLPEDVIASPPTVGWPEEHKAKFRRLGKSDTVVDLLCYIPYLTSQYYEINYETTSIDWRSDDVYWMIELHGSLNQTALEPMFQRLPSNVISLTKGSNYGRYILLDVDTGMATDYSLLGGPDPMVSDKVKSAGLAWTKHETRPLVEMLADWSEKLRSLWWIPIPNAPDHPRRVSRIGTPVNNEDPEQEEARQIYRNYGWGTNNFRKEDCRAAMVVWDVAEVRG